VLTDEDGGVTERTTWGPWGERIEGGERSRFGYTGHQTERESGLRYSVHRYLDSRNGRWTRRDPLGGVDGANLYRYVRNRSISHVDPMGLAGLDLTSVPADVKAALSTNSVAQELFERFRTCGQDHITAKVEFQPGRVGVASQDWYKVLGFDLGPSDDPITSISLESALDTRRAGNSLRWRGGWTTPYPRGTPDPRLIKAYVYAGIPEFFRTLIAEGLVPTGGTTGVTVSSSSSSEVRARAHSAAAIRARQDVLVFTATVIHELRHALDILTGVKPIEANAYDTEVQFWEGN